MFDTRIDLAAVRPGALRWGVSVGGYAGSRMDGLLRSRGYTRKGEIADFLVGAALGPDSFRRLLQAANRPVERDGRGQGVVDRAVFADVGMEQLQPLVAL